MNEEIHAWLEFAKRDFDDAQALIAAKRYHGGLYSLQQATEKLIKAYILQNDINQFPYIHDIRYLLEKAKLQPPGDLTIDLKELSLVYTRLRYPDMNKAHYSNHVKVLELIQHFTRLYQWIHQQLKNR